MIKGDTLECEDETEHQQGEEENAGDVSGPSLNGLNNPTEHVLRCTNGSPRSESREVISLVQGKGMREKKTQRWLKDYELEESSLEEEEENLNALMITMMMVAEDDPVRFEDAEKQKIWREAMMREIESIEKN